MLPKINALLFKKDYFINSPVDKINIKSVINRLNTKTNLIIHINSAKTETTTYLHACYFSPTSSMLIRSIKNRKFIS